MKRAPAVTALSSNVDRSQRPIVYSCSGYTPIAQFANDLAVTADRTGLAEMSCIAGVGGRVAPLVSKAKSGRNIVAVDGCPLHCVKNCLEQVGVEPTLHVTLTDYRLGKSLSDENAPAAVEAARMDVMQRIHELAQAGADERTPGVARAGRVDGDTVDD